MESLSPEHQEMVNVLMAVAGIKDIEFAREFLQDNNWQLEPSVNEFMMLIGQDSPRSMGARSMDGMGGKLTPAPAMPEVPVTSDLSQADYLFPPPADIIFQGNFEALRKRAHNEQKYCLVNIQKREEFTSQVLNRDTWSDEKVRTIMGFRFVFWQQEYESQAGSQHLSCYPRTLLNQGSLPIVDIIDPITGRLLERITDKGLTFSPSGMVERLTRFIDSHENQVPMPQAFILNVPPPTPASGTDSSAQSRLSILNLALSEPGNDSKKEEERAKSTRVQGTVMADDASSCQCTCKACTYRTKRPQTKCKFGFKCSRDDCVFAHARPSGTSQKAGIENYACRDGIQCKQHNCEFAHPSKSLKCKGQHQQKSDGDLLDYIIGKLKKSPTGSCPAAQLCAFVRKNDSWAALIDGAGGFKYFCLDYEDKIKWVPDGGGGKVELVKTGSIPVGAKVNIKTEEPTFGWGMARSWSVGTVRSFSGTTYIVDFPEAAKWKGEEKDLAICSGVCSDLSTQDIDTKDPAFDKFGWVRTHLPTYSGKFAFTGKVYRDAHEVQGRGKWEYGFLHGAQKLTPLQPYFEVDIIVHNDKHGVGIGLAGDSFVAGSMVGWDDSGCDSIGFHTHDGQLFYEGGGVSFGPKSSTGDTIGCGVFFDISNTPQTIYFTCNQRVVGRFPLRSKDCNILFPVVTSASPAIVKVNLTTKSPDFVMACDLKTFEFEAKYNDASTRSKPVTIMGTPNSKGETPVNFKGYKDTVWIPQSRLMKTDTPCIKEFSNLELAFVSAVDGDEIEVKDCGVHLTRDPIDIKIVVSIVGTGSAKPTISCIKEGGAVFSISASALLQNLCVNSVGGDISKRTDVGGSSGVLLHAGSLTMEACAISSITGSGVALSSKSDSKCRTFFMSNCNVGPCGRHGIILNQCAEKIIIFKVAIRDANFGVTNNGADAALIDCLINDCATGLLMYGNHHLKHRSSAQMTILDSHIMNCKDTALQLHDHPSEYDLNATLTGCTIEHCKVALAADGAKTKITSDKTNSVKDCIDVHVIENGGQIISGEDDGVICYLPSDTGSLSITETNPRSQPSPNPRIKEEFDSAATNHKLKEETNVSTETTNFARYCRLLMDVGREVMVSIFRASYQKEKGIPFTESSNFLKDNFPDGHSQRQLGKHGVDCIRASKCEKWDISLLSSLLLFIPGYIKDMPAAKDAVETLRAERNMLAHSAELLAKQSLPENEFKKKWEVVLEALNVLMDQLLPAEKSECRSKIDEIENEQVCESDLEPLFERVQEDIKHIQDKVDEAMKKAEKAATMSQVQKALDATLESVLNQHGQVGQNKLPRDIVLSNQKRYRLVKQVGRGGMGTVFEGKLVDAGSDGGQIALKICHADASSGRAEREAEILKRLGTINHDNIVKILDNALDCNHLVIVMEFIKGQALDVWLQQRHNDVTDGSRCVTFLDTKPIIKQLVEGMSAVHALHIAHRDIKPGNLIFDEVTGKLVIVDFGLSKQHSANFVTLTGTNDQLGTFLYMSPEQLAGDVKEISFPSDVWSIGIVWHEILTDSTPFEPSATASDLGGSGSRSKRRTFSRKEEGSMVSAICAEDHAKPRKLPMLDGASDVPAAVQGVIAKCLNTDKHERYQNAQELFNHLTGLFERLEKVKEDGPTSPSEEAPRCKPFKNFSVDEVSLLVRSISEGFAKTADAIKDNGIDGQYFWEMLQNDDADLITSIEEEGLGFKRLQLRIVKAKISERE